MVMTIEEAKLALQLAIDDATGALVAHVVSSDGSDVSKSVSWVTTETKEAFQTEITNAQTVYNDPDAVQEVVDGAITSLTTATTNYQAAGQPGTMETAIVDEYNLLKEEAQALLTNTKVSEDGTDV